MTEALIIAAFWQPKSKRFCELTADEIKQRCGAIPQSLEFIGLVQNETILKQTIDTSARITVYRLSLHGQQRFHNATQDAPQQIKAISGETYAQNVARRFRIPDLESPAGRAKLARIENQAMRKFMGLSNMARAQDTVTTLSEAAHEKLTQLGTERGSETIAVILDAMDQPMPARELSARTGIPISTVKKALGRALDNGLIAKAAFTGAAMWEKRA